MAIRLYSTLQNGSNIAFNPATDILRFDDPSVSAAEVGVFTYSGPVIFSSGVENKEVGLLGPQLGQISSANVTFADGSVLKIGGNTIGTANDNAANNLTGGDGADHLMGLGGNDILIGGGGDDNLDGGDGNDRLDGGAGVEFFFDFAGSNTMLGGAGDDFFFAFGSDGGANRATGGTGRDTFYTSARYGDFVPPINFLVTDFAAGAGGDFINISSSLISATYSGAYQGQDPFAAGFVRVIQSGPDALVQFDLDGSAATFHAFQTVLTLNNENAATAKNSVTGYVIGGAGNDNLLGNSSNQLLFAAAGNDVLNGGGGNDNMFGGSGRDTYHVDSGGDVVTESSNSPGGLVIGPGGEGGALDDITDIVLAAVNYSLEFANFVENLRLTGAVAKEAVGNALNNELTGNALHNRLEGLGGNDSLNGGLGNDVVLGGDGNDRIVWGTGDQVHGGAGTDTLKITSGNLLLPTLPNTKILGIEVIDMVGGTNTLTINKAEVLNLSSETDTITILGNAGDSVDITTPFTSGLVTGAFRSYNLGGGAILMIETDVAVS